MSSLHQLKRFGNVVSAVDRYSQKFTLMSGCFWVSEMIQAFLCVIVSSLISLWISSISIYFTTPADLHSQATDTKDLLKRPWWVHPEVTCSVTQVHTHIYPMSQKKKKDQFPAPSIWKPTQASAFMPELNWGLRGKLCVPVRLLQKQRCFGWGLNKSNLT